jgi:hypothetical protein
LPIHDFKPFSFIHLRPLVGPHPVANLW